MLYSWFRSVVDTKVSTKPCLVKSIILTPSSASKRGDLTLHDGESTSDPQIIKVLGPLGTTLQLNFDEPLVTQRGLYLNVGGDVGDIMIQYSWTDE